MPDLLFLSDNPKVEQVKALLQQALKLEIAVATDQGRAKEALHNHHPSVIFIQEQMTGTTAEETAWQLLTVPENGTPLLVLMREENGATMPPEQPFERVIDLNLPAEQLAESILHTVLRPAFEHRWNEISIPSEGTGAAVAPAAPVKGQIPPELLKAFEHNYRSRRRRWMQYAAISLAACLAAFAWLQPPQRREQGSAISRTPPAQPAEQQTVVAQAQPQKRVKQQPAATPAQPQKKIEQQPAAAQAQPQKRTEQRPTAVPTPSRPPAPAPSYTEIATKDLPAPRKPAASAATAPGLPSFIPAKGRDSAYSRHKPGWERYTDSKHEFRILRAGNRIKAVQVLASTPNAISEAFLKSVLAELSGKSTYQETSQREERGFSIKRGSAGPGVKLLIYGQKSRIRAFVISIS